MKLTNEAIEAITAHEKCYYLDYVSNRNTKIRSTFMVGATEALTNPEIYEKAGLISLEDAMGFAEWLPKQLGLGYSIEDKAWFSNSGKSRHTKAQLFQIYKQQK